MINYFIDMESLVRLLTRFWTFVINLWPKILVIGLLSFALFPTIIKSQEQQNGNARIAFVNDINIYRMNEDGSDRLQLTMVEPGPASHPTWSIDNNYIAFDAFISDQSGNSELNSDIFVLNLETLVSENITNHPSDDIFPVWSPIENRIAFVSNRDGNWEIYLMNTDGTSLINLTKSEANDGINGLTWSPDGTRIAFVSNRDEGRDENTGYYEADNLYMIDISEVESSMPSLEVINLTRGLDQCPTGKFLRNPSWSTNNQLAFALSCGIDWDIYVSNSDDFYHENESVLYHNLTNRPNEDGTLGLNWSPDGTKIIFVSNPSLDVPDDRELFIIDVCETLLSGVLDVIQLTDEPQVRNYYAFPVWERTSASIASETYCHSGDNIHDPDLQ